MLLTEVKDVRNDVKKADWKLGGGCNYRICLLQHHIPLPPSPFLYIPAFLFLICTLICFLTVPLFCFLQMSNKRSNSFRRAILQGSRQLKGCSLSDEAGLGLSQRLVRHVAYETLPREVDRKWYFDSYTYCPPPWFILAITIAEVKTFKAEARSALFTVKWLDARVNIFNT